MNSKVILYCFFFLCLKYVVSIPFSEELIRQTKYQPDNWQNDENIPDNSWNQDTDVSNINSMTHSARRHKNDNEYKANSESHHENYGQNKRELSPIESLSLQEVPLDSQIDPNTYPTRANKQRYRQHNSQFHSASSTSSSRANNYRGPLILAKEKPYHIPTREYSEPIRHNRGNQRNFNDDTLRPVPKYSGNVRRMNTYEINSRSQNSAENLDNYDVMQATAQATNYNRNRYLENSPPHSGSSYLAPQNYHGAKKEGYYYNNERNRPLERSQNIPTFNNRGRYLEVDNFGNPKYFEYPPINSRPKHFNKQTPDSYINRHEKTAHKNESPSSSNSIANVNSFQDALQISTIISNHPNISENTKGTKKSSGPNFTVIHKNGTVEYIDRIDDKPRYSIVAIRDKTKNDKDIVAQYDNNDRSSSNNDYNSRNAPAKSFDQIISSDGTTARALTKFSSEHIEEPADSDSSISSDNQYVGPSGNDNNSKRPGEGKKNQPTSQSDSYRHKTSTLSPEEKDVQEYLDSLPINNEEKASAKSVSNTQKSSQGHQEDELIQEFLDSLSKTPDSIQKSSNEDNDSTTQLSKSDSNNPSSTTTVSPVKTTALDEIITISSVETSTENVRSQSSNDSISKLTSEDTKTNYDSDGTKTNDDGSTNLKDSDRKCHNSADSDCLTNIDAPTYIDDSTTETIDNDKQSDVNNNNKSVTVNDLKLILDIPNDSTGTLKLVLNLPDNTGKDGTTDEEKLKISVDTKDYRESDSGVNKNYENNDNSNEKSNVDKDKKTLIDLINNITTWNKTIDKDFINQSPSDNSTVNLWYLIQMQPQCQPVVEKSKVTTIYPNGTIVEEWTETTRQNKDDDEPIIVKTTKISHKYHKRH